MDKPEYPTCKWQNYKGMDNLKYELPLESSKPLLDLTLEVSYCSEMMPKWYVSCPSFAQETCQISAIWNFARVLLIALFHILFHHLSFGNFWLWIQFYHQVGCRHRRHCVLTNKAQTKWTNQNIQHANDKTTKVWTIWSMNCLWKVPNLCWISLWKCHIVSEMMPKWYVSCPSFAQETCQISAIWNFARVLLIALFHILFHHLSFGNFWLWIQFYHQVGCRHRRHCVLTNKAQTKWTNQNIQHANDKTTKVWTIWSMNCLWKVPNLCWISLWKCHIVAKWCQNDMSHVPLLRRKHVRFLQFEISLESSWSLCFIFSSTISVLETSGSESNFTTKLAAGTGGIAS